MKFQGNNFFKNFFIEYAELSEEWTKAILTRVEFESLRENEEKLKKVTAENKNKDSEIIKLESIINKTRTELNTLKNEQTLLKSELEKKIALLENQNKILTSQNDNLSRINRERSNAERKLYPKKLHNGYVLLHQESYNKNYSFKIKYQYNYNLLLYKYRLETPYLCDLELDYAKSLIIQDLKKFYHLEHLQELPRNKDFFETIKSHKYLLNFKISSSARYYQIEFSSNATLKEKES